VSEHCIEFPAECARPNVGEVVSSNPPNSSNRNEDSVDVAVLRLSPQQAAAIEASVHSRFRSKPEGYDEAVDGDEYVFTGYPSSRNRFIARYGSSTRIRYRPSAVPHDDRTRDHGRDPAFHVASLYDRQNSVRNGVRGIAPEAWGMSGGAIWKLDRATGDCVLVGIGRIERRSPILNWHSNRAAAALMRAGFPETVPYLPIPGRFTTAS